MTTLLPRRTHTTVVERILFLFVAEFTACLDLMRAILNYTAQIAGAGLGPARGRIAPYVVKNAFGYMFLITLADERNLLAYPSALFLTPGTVCSGCI
jgi:hypothetical protein